MPERAPAPYVVLVFGSTGTAGSGVVRACLADPAVTEVRAVTRRPLGVDHPKLLPVMCSDFADMTAIAEHLRGVHACLYCLGVSATKVSGEAQYREIHVDYPMATARALQRESAEAAFVLLSGSGASRRSRMMWARVKAEAEDRLAELGLTRLACVRPAIIVPTEPGGPMRWLVAPLVRHVARAGITAVDLGHAMLALARGDQAIEGPVDNRGLRALVP